MEEYKVGQRIEYAINETESSNGDIVCIHDEHVLVLDDFDRKVITVLKSDILTMLRA